jgi:hypothetical protein
MTPNFPCSHGLYATGGGSVLLDAGETIKALAEYLGHSDPGFTLRTYTHLMPSSESRTRRAIDLVFAPESVSKPVLVPALAEETNPGGAPVPVEEKSSGVCTRCALAA